MKRHAINDNRVAPTTYNQFYYNLPAMKPPLSRKPRRTRTLDDHLPKGFWIVAALLSGALIWVGIYFVFLFFFAG